MDKRWTIENALIAVKKYKNRKELISKDKNLYNYISRNKIRNLAFLHMPNNQSHPKHTKEEILIVARQYKTREEFRKAYPALYDSARYNGWYNEAVAHMKRMYRVDYTFEECHKAALQYKTRNEFRVKDSKRAAFSCHHGWFEDICSHMPKPKTKPQINWTYKLVLDEAKKYKTRKEFGVKSSSAYQYALRNKCLNEICSHMEQRNNRWKRCIYAAEFSDNHVYIGLTYNTEKRWKRELSDHSEAVYKHIKKTGIQPIFKVIHDYELSDIAAKLEGEYIDVYLKAGWNILNKNSAGALGGNPSEYTLEDCIEKAKKCSSLKEFRKSYPNIYSFCVYHKWKKYIQEVLPPRYKTYTDEEVINIAKSFLTRALLRKGNPAAYQIISNRELKPQAFAHMPDYTNKKFHKKNKEEAIETAKKYSTVKDFRVNDASTYQKIQREGWQDEAFSHMVSTKKKHYKWTKERLQEASKLCKTRSEFKKKFHWAYSFACKEGIIDELCIHMPNKSEALKLAYARKTRK